MEIYADKFVSPATADQGDRAQGRKEHRGQLGGSEQKKIRDMPLNHRGSAADRHEKDSVRVVPRETDPDGLLQFLHELDAALGPDQQLVRADQDSH